MTLPEFFGYLASVLVFMTFYMRTMVALRCVAVLSNVAFITYGYLESLFPVLILHVLLLPTNLLRLEQIRRLLRDIAGFRDQGFPLEPLVPFMRERRVHRGEVLFQKGDQSTEMFYLAKGRVRIAEISALLQPGDIFGEISLFAPDHQRTGTAIAEDGGIVFSLSERAVLQIFYQNPQIGYALIRTITERLIENLRRLEASERYSPQTQDVVRLRLASRVPPPPAMPDGRKVKQAEAVLRAARRRRRLAYAALALVPIMLLAATVYSERRYFASVLFRDAVVTSWVYVATAPISGQLEPPMPQAGDVVAGSGAVVRIRNMQADDTELARLDSEVAQMQDRGRQLEEQLSNFRQTSMSWQRRARIYAEVFRDSLDAELTGLEEELAFVDRQLELANRVANRLEALASQGNVSLSTADERLAGIMELTSHKSALEKEIARARRRYEAAKEGVFITADGNNPDWAFDSSDVLELKLIETADALAAARGSLIKLAEERQAAEVQFARANLAEVTVPAGSLIWSVAAGPGATVGRGAPLVEWIDCSRPLVDVPVSEVGLAVISAGMTAEVWIDELAGPVVGTVIYMRGASARLDRRELAAVAGGDSSLAQVVLALDAGHFGPDNCPVGRAAFVDFPAIGPLDRFRAFLRL